MATELITENHGIEIKNVLNTVENKVLIVSTYMGMKTCEVLSNIYKNNDIVINNSA